MIPNRLIAVNRAMLLPLLLLPSLALAFSWASLFGGKGVNADQYIMTPEQEVVKVPSVPRIAIVGAGAAGSSAAFWISKAAQRAGQNVIVDIYDRNDYIGGRSTIVYPYNDTSLHRAELGASIFVDANKNMVRAAKEFELDVTKFEDGDEVLGIWDGQKFLVTLGANSYFGKIWENIRMLWRYGYRSPITTRDLVKQMVNTYLTLYSSITSWSTVESLSEQLSFTSFTTQSTDAYLSSQGVGDLYMYEVVEASTRVNYAANLDKIHALEGMCSMAANGAMGIKEGNYRVFEEFTKRSGANVHLKTEVKGMKQDVNGRWILSAGKPDSTAEAEARETYDSVILAAPINSLTVDLPENITPQIVPVDYVHLHVTLLSTTDPHANPAYFGLPEGESVPSFILTSAQGIREGGPAPEFNSMSYHKRIADGRDEWTVKIFSMQRVEDEWLAKVFSNVGWVYRKEWDAYPKLPTVSKYTPLRLDQGLYYVNGFESFISTMETETLASRGVVNLMMNDMFQTGICPEGVLDPPPEGVDFVWGWDC